MRAEMGRKRGRMAGEEREVGGTVEDRQREIRERVLHACEAR